MTICAFKVCTSSLSLGINIPASASLVRDQRSAIGSCDLLCKGCIVLDGLEAVLDGKCGSLEFFQSFGKFVIGLLGEDEFRRSGEGHLRGAVMQEAVWMAVTVRLRKLVGTEVCSCLHGLHCLHCLGRSNCALFTVALHRLSGRWGCNRIKSEETWIAPFLSSSRYFLVQYSIAVSLHCSNTRLGAGSLRKGDGSLQDFGEQ
jgi:hypothetical protein